MDYLEPDMVYGLNLYEYCMNDPVNYSDGSGHSPDSIWKTLLGIAVAVGLAVVTVAAVVAFWGTLLVPVLLDVRTAAKYHAGHIDGSVNIPLDRISSVENTVKDKSTPLYVHCFSGGRSGQTVSYLKQIGYTNKKNIGGISSCRGKVVK